MKEHLIYFTKKMQLATNDILNSRMKIISFHEVVLWDVKRYSSKKIQSDYPIVKLGSCIQEQSHRVRLSDFPDEEFGILGVSNKVGIFDAYQEKGGNINQPYKKMKDGWLAYNPYRINVGSVGVKTNIQKYDFISPAYIVFSCGDKLLPDFLYKLFKTECFNRIINENTTGSVRQSLTFDILKTLDIPLPPVSRDSIKGIFIGQTQEEFLRSYYLKIEEAKKQDKEAENKELEINSYLLDVLGVNIEKNERQKGMSFTKYSFIDRWATDYLFNVKSIKGITEAKYPTLKVKNFLLSFQYGSSSKASEEPAGTPILRMNNIVNAELNIADLKYIQIDEFQKEKLLLEKGDLLFNRTNSKELVGKTAVFELNGDYVFASYLIRLKLDSKKVNPHYINYLFNSPIGRMQIDMVSRQVLGQANVNAQELQDFIFPIPKDIKIQNQIVREISCIKNEAKKLRDKAEHNRQKAIKEFEQALFKQS